MITLNIIDQQTLLPTGKIAAIVAAIQTQVSRDFAPYYTDAHLHVSRTDDGSGYPIWLIDTDDQSPPGALAWHSVDGGLRPYGIVPVKPVLDGGYDLGPTVSHEVLELLADPYCMKSVLVPEWNGAPAAFFSYEVADPCEDVSYKIALDSGEWIDVSDFVLPAWFHAQGAGLVDFSNKLSSPLSITPGGYVQYIQGGEWRDSYGTAARSFRTQHGPHSRRNRKRRRHGSPA